MRPDEILVMIQRLERIFCRECAQINLKSQLLLQSIADKKAETKFHYIIQVIRRKNGPNKQDYGDELITYGEFYEAVKSKDQFYKQILPRTLNIEDVLQCQKTEEVYNISDLSYDDFVLFRYEMNTIFKKTHFRANNDENLMEFGTSPLSRIGGMLIRDLPQNERKKQLELYRPPGIVRKVRYLPEAEVDTQFGQNIWNCVPNNKIYIRDPTKKEEAEDEKSQKETQGSKKAEALKKKLRINIMQKQAQDIEDFYDLFDTDFPIEYNEIVNGDQEEGENQGDERDIKEMIRKSEKRYKEVKNLFNNYS